MCVCTAISKLRVTPSHSGHDIDFILAASDVEGNFLVVKVRFLVSPYKTTFSYRRVTGIRLHGSAILHAPRRVRLIATLSSHFIRLTLSLLRRWAIPSCMFFVYLYTRRKYHWTQLLVSHPRFPLIAHLLMLSQGVMVCVVGLGLTVASDHFTGKNWTPVSRGKGDAFMIAGATLYGFCTFYWSTVFA
jgi:hypothetical protein